MITVKLIGGLGNQMFQYAIGRHLAEKNRTALSLDISTLLKRDEINYTPRNFELNVFNVKYSKLINKPSSSYFNKAYNKLFTSTINEKGYNYDSQVLSNKGNIYLNGFWQTEQYFKDIEEIIRKDFTFKATPNAININHIKNINAANSVSIHFRRGDYITNSSAVDFHGICEPEYYQNAINEIKNKVTNPHFFIFSDDVEWVQENFIIDNATIISNNTASDAFEDMRLMAACKHNIIANSSFSWWAAWLNNNPDKIVIAPKRWLKNIEIDIIPVSWTKI